MSRLLAMVNLPYRNPETSTWTRSNGIVRINISSGFNGDECIGIPYGIYPRLILFYIITEAIKNKSSEIYLGENFDNFIKKINFDIKGGNQRNAIQLQLRKIISSQFSWTQTQEDKNIKSQFSISSTYKVWWPPKIVNGKRLFDTTIKLNKEFYREIVNNSIPLDFEIIKQLRDSPMAIDLYVFLTWRTFNLKKSLYISWENLEFQLGNQYTDRKDFSKKCSKYIKIIKSLCPYLNIEIFRGRIRLSPSF